MSDDARVLADAWFDEGEPGATARSCPECPNVRAAIPGAVGYFTSRDSLARHLRRVHGWTTGRLMEATP